MINEFGREPLQLPKGHKVLWLIGKRMQPGRPKGNHRSVDAGDSLSVRLHYYKSGPNIRFEHWITQEAQKEMIQVITETIFYPTFFMWMDERRKAGIQIQDCIDQFVSVYGLNYDVIDFETLKKRYYRYRKATQPVVNVSKKISEYKPLQQAQLSLFP
jgi:hypothetical protein